EGARPRRRARRGGAAPLPGPMTPARAALAALATGFGLVATGALATPSPAPFDGAYAYELVKLQLSHGPRPAGSAAQRAVAERLVALLPGGHFEAVPGGLRNMVGELPGRSPAIVVAAHY